MKTLLLAGVLLLAGCTLVDRRTFAPSPEAEDTEPPRRSVRTDDRNPLLVIDYAAGVPRYRDFLRVAVNVAESRNANVEYDVVQIGPALPDGGPKAALEVMTAIMAERVPAHRVHLGVRADPAMTTGQVRVYVR